MLRVDNKEIKCVKLHFVWMFAILSNPDVTFSVNIDSNMSIHNIFLLTCR
jgi:hypothetical protein